MIKWIKEKLGINSLVEAVAINSAIQKSDNIELDEDVSDLQKQIAELSYLIANHTHGQPHPPVEPPPLPFYIDYMRKAHKTLTDEELSETVWLECETLTHFYEPIYQDAEKTRWNDNDEGWPFVQPAQKKDDHEIHAGQEVKVYRWAFPANGGVVREVVYRIDGLKRLINIKAFTAPE